MAGRSPCDRSKKNTVRVRFRRTSACAGSCKNCGACGVLANLETEVSLPAPPGRRLQPGDRVLVAMASSGFLRAAFLLYLVPLVFFFGGYAVGDRLFARLGLPGLGGGRRGAGRFYPDGFGIPFHPEARPPLGGVPAATGWRSSMTGRNRERRKDFLTEKRKSQVNSRKHLELQKFAGIFLWRR